MATAAHGRYVRKTLCPRLSTRSPQGVDALELDMAVTKDNVLVISHDPLLHPPVCSGPVPEAAIHDLTLAQVREWDCGKVKIRHFPGSR